MTLDTADWCWPLLISEDGRKPTISDGFHARGSVERAVGHRGQDIMYRRRPPMPFASLPWKSRAFEIPIGTEAVAANRGSVFRCGRLDTGWHVIIDHGDHLGTGYYHLSELHPDVKRGVLIRMGQPLGLVGYNPIGYKLAHLHFDVAINGHFIDAAKVMRAWHYER